MFALSKASDLN